MILDTIINHLARKERFGVVGVKQKMQPLVWNAHLGVKTLENCVWRTERGVENVKN